MATTIPLVITYSSIVGYLLKIIKFRLAHRRSEDKDILVICSSQECLLQRLKDAFVSGPMEPELNPTLETLALTRNLEVIFASSYLHLRAYISTIQPDTHSPGLLAVWGLTASHYESSEFSAQGIGRTAAAVVDAGLRSGKRVVLGEGSCERQDVNKNEADRLNWVDVQVRMLNTTVKADNLDEEVLGRTVDVRGVLERWFQFEDGSIDISID